MEFYYGSRYKLWEKANVQQQLERVSAQLLRPSVYVDDVGEALKGEKGYTYGQDYPGQRYAAAGDGVYIADNEVQI